MIDEKRDFAYFFFYWNTRNKESTKERKKERKIERKKERKKEKKLDKGNVREKDSKKKNERKHERKKPVAQRHHMVSRTLALLKYLEIYMNGKQGSGPDRGQSPVEWGEIPSVRPS